MNKWFKRIGALVLSATLALSGMAISASAETTALPDTDTTRTLTIHKYLMDDLADAKDTSTGKELADEDIPESATPLGGIVFDVYATIDAEAYGKLEADAQANYVQVGTTGYYYDKTSAPVKTLTTADETGIATTDFGTDNGIYAVVEQFDERVASPALPFVVSVPMTDPTNGNAWIYDVHVYPKNAPLGLDKTVDSTNTDTAYVPSKGASYSVGDQFDWQIKSDIPAAIATFKDYSITDSLDGRLTYVSTTVKIGDTTLEEGTDYVLTTTAGTDANGKANTTVKVEFITYEADGTTVKVDGRAKLAAYLEADDSDKKVTVNITTILNSINGISVIDNKATLDVTNENGDESHPTTPDETTPKVYVGGFGIDKFEKGDETKKLEGAKFKLASSEDNAKAGNFLKKLKADVVLTEDKTFADGSVVKSGATLIAGTILDVGDPYYDDDTAAEDYEVTTDKNGAAIFTGLKLDIVTDPTSGAITTDNGKAYYLVETQAPEIKDAEGNGTGKFYNLLDTPKEVTVKFGAAESTMTIGNDTYVNVSSIEKIANSKGFTLPLTGGTGTAIFTAAGIVMAGLGICLFITMKKKKANAAA